MATQIAKSKAEWWELTMAALTNWNIKCHEDDRMGVQDWVDEIGESYGWQPFRDRNGDLDVKKNKACQQIQE